MIIVNERLCDICGTCAGVCPVDAIVIEKQGVTIVSECCSDCGICVHVCPVDALSEDGNESNEVR